MAIEDVTKQKMLEEKLQAYSRQLEEKVMERTKELEARVVELEKINKDVVDRELRMIELKKQMDEMRKKMPQ